MLSLARNERGTKVYRQKGIEYARRLSGNTIICTSKHSMHLDENELAEAQYLVD